MDLHLRRFSAMLVAVAFGSTCADSAVANPFGTQSPLSALTEVDTAERPAIATGNGVSLVVWRSRVADASGLFAIGGRLVGSDSAPVSEELQLDETCCSRPSRPDVTYNAARDEFLVVWRAEDYPNGVFVFAQRVGSDGALKGDRVTIEDTGDDDEVARVAWASGVDQYLVVWDQDQLGGRGCCSFAEEVLGLRLRGDDATPFPVETPLHLSNGVISEDYPDVAYDPVHAKWLVAFEGAIDDDDEQGTRGGTDPEVLVTTATAEDVVDGPRPISTPGDAINRPAVAANTRSGGFAVTWSRQEQNPVRTSFDGDVVARLVDANGNGVGDEVDVSPTDDLAWGASPAIAYDSNADEYLIVWWQHLFGLSRGPVEVVDQVAGRRYSAALAPLSDAALMAVIGDPFTRGAVVGGAEQPVAAFDAKTCSYVSAYEITAFSTNVASRGFSAPPCAQPDEDEPIALSGRDSTVRGAETTTVTASSLVATRCKSRRVFSIRLVTRRSRRYKSATVTVNGRVVKRLKGNGGEATVDLEGLPAGTFSVKLVAKLADGRTLSYTRKYRTCNRKLKASNRLHTKKAV